MLLSGGQLVPLVVQRTQPGMQERKMRRNARGGILGQPLLVGLAGGVQVSHGGLEACEMPARQVIKMPVGLFTRQVDGIAKCRSG